MKPLLKWSKWLKIKISFEIHNFFFLNRNQNSNQQLRKKSENNSSLGRRFMFLCS